jgi:hypothetical protein
MSFPLQIYTKSPLPHLCCGSGLAAIIVNVTLPVGQNVANLGRVGQAVHILKVLLGDLEWPGGDVGNVFANEFARIDASLVDLLEQEGTEGLDTRAQEGAVEWHIDTLERNRGETTLEVKRLGLGLGLFCASLDDLDEVTLDVFEGHGLHQ